MTTITRRSFTVGCAALAAAAALPTLSRSRDPAQLVDWLESVSVKIYATKWEGRVTVAIAAEDYLFDDPGHREVIEYVNTWNTDPTWPDYRERLVPYLVATGRTYGMG